MWGSNISLASNKYYDNIPNKDHDKNNIVLDLTSRRRQSNPKISINNVPIAELEDNDDSVENEKKEPTLLQKLTLLFDLDLLTDCTYVNLMIGMSLAIFAEINFSLLTPFILNDMHFSTQQIASIMSMIAIFDIVFRFISPFIGDYFKLSTKVMYMFSMVLLIFSRSAILFWTSYSEVMVVAAFLGVSKGFRTVYMSLVIPSYVPLEKLASASGIQMVVNGIILLVAGPFLGIIRDKTGSFANCIVLINFVTFLTLVLWTLEYLVKRFCINKNDNKT